MIRLHQNCVRAIIGRETGVAVGGDLTVWRRDASHSCQRQSSAMTRQLKPVDTREDVLHSVTGLVQHRALINKAGYDTLYQGDLSVFESLEAPAVEFDAEDFFVAREIGLNHLQDAGFASTPITVNADRNCMIRPLTDEGDYCPCDSLLIEQINLGFVVSE